MLCVIRITHGRKFNHSNQLPPLAEDPLLQAVRASSSTTSTISQGIRERPQQEFIIPNGESSSTVSKLWSFQLC